RMLRKFPTSPSLSADGLIEHLWKYKSNSLGVHWKIEHEIDEWRNKKPVDADRKRITRSSSDHQNTKPTNQIDIITHDQGKHHRQSLSTAALQETTPTADNLLLSRSRMENIRRRLDWSRLRDNDLPSHENMEILRKFIDETLNLEESVQDHISKFQSAESQLKELLASSTTDVDNVLLSKRGLENFQFRLDWSRLGQDDRLSRESFDVPLTLKNQLESGHSEARIDMPK
ncbi:hypothetical protein HDU76_011910, partial [Blyttiomyces sp. JEL0837]